MTKGSCAKYTSIYSSLINKFMSTILENKINVRGMPTIHLPHIGKNYETSKYKLAFFGMETNGWGYLSEDLKKWKKHGAESILKDMNDYFYEHPFLEWRNNFKSSYFDFVIRFLSKFYNKDIDEQDNNGTYLHSDLLQSFIWGNTNSIERYTVTAKDEGVKEDNYNKIKQISRDIFDNAIHIIKACAPDIIIITNWGEAESWLTKKIPDSNCEEISDHLWYYAIRYNEKKTSVFWTVHPHYQNYDKGLDWYIEEILRQISQNKLLEGFKFDKCYRDNKREDLIIEEEEEIPHQNLEAKRSFIADLAMALYKNNTVMTGGQLANLLTQNGFVTSYGTQYCSGKRGIYKLLKSVYQYYLDNGKTKEAEAISKAFVNQWLNPAWL